jgi:hypothetical protein
MALARKVDPSSRPAADRELAAVLDALRRDASRQAIFFADQIVTADKLLIKDDSTL